MGFLQFITPKNFLGNYSLETGARCIGIAMCCINVICVIALLVQLFIYQQCTSCATVVTHNLNSSNVVQCSGCSSTVVHVYSFSINAAVYCICMIFVNLWLLFGIRNKKSSVILSWVVITTMWLLQGACYVMILMCINITSYFNIGWIFAIIFAVILFFIFIYAILVGYGYWLELKGNVEVPQQRT